MLEFIPIFLWPRWGYHFNFLKLFPFLKAVVFVCVFLVSQAIHVYFFKIIFQENMENGGKKSAKFPRTRDFQQFKADLLVFI